LDENKEGYFILNSHHYRVDKNGKRVLLKDNEVPLYNKTLEWQWTKSSANLSLLN